MKNPSVRFPPPRVSNNRELCMMIMYVFPIAILATALVLYFNAQLSELRITITVLNAQIGDLQLAANRSDCQQNAATALALDFINAICSDPQFDEYTGPCPIVLSRIFAADACAGAPCNSTFYPDTVSPGETCFCDEQCNHDNSTCSTDVCSAPPIVCAPGTGYPAPFAIACENCAESTYSPGGVNAPCLDCAVGCDSGDCEQVMGNCTLCAAGYGGLRCDPCPPFTWSSTPQPPAEDNCLPCSELCDEEPGVCDVLTGDCIVCEEGPCP